MQIYFMHIYKYIYTYFIYLSVNSHWPNGKWPEFYTETCSLHWKNNKKIFHTRKWKIQEEHGFLNPS